MNRSDLSPDELAQALAEGLGIPANSYGDRVGDAIIAMSLLKAYRRFSQTEREAALRAIYEDMNFGSTNPLFWHACQTAAIMIVANPAWVPASMTNDELESEISFWRGVAGVLKKFGFEGFPSYAVGNAKTAFEAAKQELLKGGSSGPSNLRVIGATAWRTVKPNAFTGATVFGNVVRSIADASASDLEDEATRRGLTGEMTRLDAGKYGARP